MSKNMADARPGTPQRKPSSVELEQSLDQLSWLMDGVFRIPGLGWRFGLDAIIGLVPGVGDLVSSLANFYVLIAAIRYRVPKITILRMAINICIDYLIGLVPFAGDVVDAWWKATQKNVDLIRRYSTVSAKEAKGGTLSDWIFVGVLIFILFILLVSTVGLSLWILYTVVNTVRLPI
jgi:hypothetical protein